MRISQREFEKKVLEIVEVTRHVRDRVAKIAEIEGFRKYRFECCPTTGAVGSVQRLKKETRLQISYQWAGRKFGGYAHCVVIPNN